jgi:hypothetical protein
MRPNTGSGRGRHRNARSPETRKWEQIANSDWLRVAKTAPSFSEKPKPRSKPERSVYDPTPPPRPCWLDQHEYEALCELRRRIL